MRSVSDLKTAD